MKNEPEPAQPQRSELVDPVTGYRYDQEIPEPICDMQQIGAASRRPAGATSEPQFYDPKKHGHDEGGYWCSPPAVATSEPPQDWTPSKHHQSCRPSDSDLVWLCSQCGGHEPAELLLAAITAERERLLAAQAAIERLIQLKGKCPWCGYIPHIEGCFMSLDFSVLREHDAEVSKSAVNHYIEVYQERNIAEVRKPLVTANLRLVEALILARSGLDEVWMDTHSVYVTKIDAALAQVKEQP